MYGLGCKLRDESNQCSEVCGGCGGDYIRIRGL